LLRGGADAELFRHSGKGGITPMWFGGDSQNYGLPRIRIYVDGERHASCTKPRIVQRGPSENSTRRPLPRLGLRVIKITLRRFWAATY
jgi:hypothetical protein